MDLQDLGLFATLAIRSGLELPKLRYEQKLLIRWLLIGQTSFTMLEEARVEIAQTTFVSSGGFQDIILITAFLNYYHLPTDNLQFGGCKRPKPMHFR